jgi:hypothetical protein
MTEDTEQSATGQPLAERSPAAFDPRRRPTSSRGRRLWPSTRTAWTLWSGILLLVVSAPAQATGLPHPPKSLDEDATSGDWTLVKELLRAMRAADPTSLAEHVDFPGRVAEGVARGTTSVGWDDLDSYGQLLEAQRTVEAWLAAKGGFFQSGMLYQLRVVDDPDAGWGPVPDRRILQAVVKSARYGKVADLLVVTAEGRLLDLVCGEPYVIPHNPLGEQGLLPQRRVDVTGMQVGWPTDTDEFDQESVIELIDGLLAAERMQDRKPLSEALHRSPRAAAAGLLIRILEIQDSALPDVPAQARLMDVLELITGRQADFQAVPSFGQTEAAWDAANRGALDSWVRWYGRQGDSFAPASVDDPDMLTLGERLVGGKPARDHVSSDGPVVSTSEATPSGSTPFGSTTPDSATPGPTHSGAAPAQPTTGAPPSQPDRPADPPEPAPTNRQPEAPTGRPKVSLRKPPAAAPRGNLSEQAASLEVLWGDRRLPAGEVADELTPTLRRALDTWAPTIQELGLSVCFSGNSDHWVMGRVPDELLVSAARAMDDTWDLLDALLPRLKTSAPRPTLAILFDEASGRDEQFWPALLSALQSNRALLKTEVSSLSRDPSGLMVRGVPMFLQPTHDMAGDASAGDDEFRLANEIRHKFAQCLLTERCGQQPISLRWALGHLVENRLLGTVYQFNTTGFVSAGDHFDWAQTASRLIEKRTRKRSYSLSEDVLDDDGGDTQNAIVTWGVLESLLAFAPTEFSALFESLFELHAAEDPYGLADEYQGADVTSLAVVEARLARLPLDEIIDHLESLE